MGIERQGITQNGTVSNNREFKVSQAKSQGTKAVIHHRNTLAGAELPTGLRHQLLISRVPGSQPPAAPVGPLQGQVTVIDGKLRAGVAGFAQDGTRAW
ncbi:hypothetical protein GCM10007071_08260 [Marinobacter zhanjiangensis]|uniref:Filamentous hemagglutinin n=1 Tax=Marinobacter zhanjiangensis TaxID=578215 RepID=A0ABQ3ARK3_9GAMM|nr:hypothetical protein GCM10007071_08260 [Marinobacter zhanjiangensis]